MILSRNFLNAPERLDAGRLWQSSHTSTLKEKDCRSALRPLIGIHRRLRRVSPRPWAFYSHSAPTFYPLLSIRFHKEIHRLFILSRAKRRQAFHRLSAARPPRLRAWRRCAHPRCRARGVPLCCGSAASGLRRGESGCGPIRFGGDGASLTPLGRLTATCEMIIRFERPWQRFKRTRRRRCD